MRVAAHCRSVCTRECPRERVKGDGGGTHIVHGAAGQLRGAWGRGAWRPSAQRLPVSRCCACARFSIWFMLQGKKLRAAMHGRLAPAAVSEPCATR